MFRPRPVFLCALRFFDSGVMARVCDDAVVVVRGGGWAWSCIDHDINHDLDRLDHLSDPNLPFLRCCAGSV